MKTFSAFYEHFLFFNEMHLTNKLRYNVKLIIRCYGRAREFKSCAEVQQNYYPAVFYVFIVPVVGVGARNWF